jgi:hypothetical protein
MWTNSWRRSWPAPSQSSTAACQQLAVRGWLGSGVNTCARLLPDDLMSVGQRVCLHQPQNLCVAAPAFLPPPPQLPVLRRAPHRPTPASSCGRRSATSQRAARMPCWPLPSTASQHPRGRHRTLPGSAPARSWRSCWALTRLRKLTGVARWGCVCADVAAAERPWDPASAARSSDARLECAHTRKRRPTRLSQPSGWRRWRASRSQLQRGATRPSSSKVCSHGQVVGAIAAGWAPNWASCKCGPPIGTDRETVCAACGLRALWQVPLLP